MNSIISSLIYDRKISDYLKIRRLNSLGWGAMSQEEKNFYLQDGLLNCLDGQLLCLDGAIYILGEDMKGAYNARDLNRVGEAVDFLQDLLNGVQQRLDDYRDENGVGSDPLFNTTWNELSLTVKVDWDIDDIPSLEQMTDYLNNVKAVTACIPVSRTLPNSMNNLNVRYANGIEKALFDEYNEAVSFEAGKRTLIENTAKSFVYSGQPYSGMIWGNFT